VWTFGRNEKREHKCNTSFSVLKGSFFKAFKNSHRSYSSSKTLRFSRLSQADHHTHEYIKTPSVRRKGNLLLLLRAHVDVHKQSFRSEVGHHRFNVLVIAASPAFLWK
jgi:hypothetical protein